MSAPGITYSGVLAKRAANSNNNEKYGIFQGLKLWVSVRVPQRNACIDIIRENGGSITPREKDADLLICDPEKAPLSGSYSYRLIEDAVKDCSLDAKEDYLCNSSAIRPGAPAGSSSNPKLTRSRFTEKDDQALTEYVREMEASGEPINGNDIYKYFADKHPSHTWQSWRDRWVKRLQHVPRQPVSKEKKSSLPERSPVASRRRTALDSSSIPAPKTKQRWTIEEDETILNAIHQAIKSHEPWDGAILYRRLAHKFPQRTHLAWRERALNHVAKQNRDILNQWQAEAESQLSDIDGHSEHLSSDKNGEDNNAEMRDATPQRKSDGIVVRTESEESDVQAGKNTTRNGSRKDQITGSAKRPPAAEPLEKNASSHRPAPITSTASESTESEMKAQFYRDYGTFLESIGNSMPPMPSVGGKAIALWDLWKSVISKKVDPIELDWQQIAEDLGFDWIVLESAPDQLRRCYEMHLASFAEFMMDFNESSDEDSTEGDVIAEAERPLPSSPPIRLSLKRVRDMADTISEQTPAKRRILSREDEIPSTPESHNRIPRFQSQEPGTTPTASRRQAQQRGEYKSGVRGRLNVSGRADGVVSDAQTIQLHKQGQRVEPETQDFAFGPDTQPNAVDDLSDQADDSQRVTPSQQLRQESLAESPRKVVQQTPTPNRRIRVLFQQNTSDDEISHATRSARAAQGPNTTQKAQPKRRTLPASFVPATHHINNDNKNKNKPGVRDSDQQQQTSSAPIPETEPRRRPTPPLPPKETPDDIIDRFVSFGYSRDIVLRSLKATSWIIGNAGQVMEMLKQGEPLPQRTTGVWTARDDESLALVFSDTAAANEKEEKKRAKEMRRLQAKHGPEQIALRKRYLLDEIPT